MKHFHAGVGLWGSGVLNRALDSQKGVSSRTGQQRLPSTMLSPMQNLLLEMDSCLEKGAISLVVLWHFAVSCRAAQLLVSIT